MQSRKFIAILTGALLTNALVYFGLTSAVVAAAIVGLVFAIIVAAGRLKSMAEFLPMLYMGTFVGMSNLKSLSLPIAVLSLVLASVGALLVTQLLAKRFIGMGGKLGLIAFVAGVPVMLTQGLAVPGKALPVDGNALVSMTAIAMIVLMISVYLRKQVASPVGISALISLLGALTPYPALVMSASFAGMSSDQNLSAWRLGAIALVFAGVYGLCFGLVQGIGGWLGLLACVSVLIVVSGERAVASIRSSLGEAEEAA